MEEVIGMNVRKITPLRYWPKSLAMLFQAKEGRPIPYFESVIKRKDGRLVPVESAGQAIIRNGKVVGIQIITRDISERKKAEEALRDLKRSGVHWQRTPRTLLWLLIVTARFSSSIAL